jgi:Ca2+/H+ antiporter, TMEM165/GDT1 family
MESVWISTLIVALAEIGDKTQLLALVLAARFRQPWSIVAAILVATALNHTAAAGLGFLVAQWLTGRVFQTLVGAGFIAMALWTLVPDKANERAGATSAGGVFMTTLVAFFLVEIGDKTQIATSLLAARFHDIAYVAIGTTLGMLIANAPVVFAGDALARIVPLKIVRRAAAFLFAITGAWVLWATLAKA